MPNPLASLPASVKLRCSTTPPQVVSTDYNGALVSIYKVTGVVSLPPAGASPTGSVGKTVTAIAGSSYLFLAPGNTPTDVPAGATLAATEFAATTTVESTQADVTKTGCTFTNTGELVKVPTAANNDALLVGAKVTGTSIAAGASIATVNNLKYTVAVVSNGLNTTITVANSGTITLAAGQFVTINNTNFTVSAAVSGSTTFIIVGTQPPAGTYIATIGALLTLSAAGVTGDQTGATLTVGGNVKVTDIAVGAVSSGSYTFNTYATVRTFADARDGDYFEMAVGMAVNPTDQPSSYVYLNGYIRRADNGTKTFLVWSTESDDNDEGGPVSTVANNNPWFVSYVTSEAPYINVYQKKALPFNYLANTKLAGRVLSLPSGGVPTKPLLVYGSPPPKLRPTGLRGRLVAAPRAVGLSANDFLRVVRAPLIGRMPAAPELSLVEKSFVLATERLSARVTGSDGAPELVGGYLRMPSQLCRAVIGQHALVMASNGEDFHGRGSLRARVPLARLTGHEYLRMISPVRALVNGTATFVILGRGLSVRDAVGDCLGVWNLRYTPRGCIGEDVRERALADLNAAMQVIYSRARRLDYFNRVTRTVQVGPGERATALPNNVQAVLGTVRVKETEEAVTSTPLFALGSLAEVMQFGALYGGTGSSPAAYFIDRRTQPEANVVRSSLMLAPVPTQTVYVDVEVASEAPRYTWQDVEMATPLQLPATYAESLLMPIVRQRATTFRLFTNDSLRPTIEAHYKKAQAALGLLDAAPLQAELPQTADTGGRE